MLTRLLVAVSRVRALFDRRRLDDDFEAEVAAHLAMLTDENVRRGMPRDAAARAAAVRFGGRQQLVERQREARGLPFVETTLRDLRYAWRSLRRNPAFAAVSILTLAIGIAAATAMFTVAHAVLLRPLPFPEPDRLIEVSETNPLKGWTHTVVAPANLTDWRARNTAFTDIAGYIGLDDRGASEYRVFLSGSGGVQALNGIPVMGNLFDVLRAAPLLGRTFTFDETFEGRDRVVVLSHGTWQTVFGADPAIVGRTIVLSGRSITVIGVMPPGFFFPNKTVQFWVPVGLKPDVFTTMRRPHWMHTVARLRAGVSIAQARDQMTTIAADLERTYPDTNTKMGVRLEPLHGIMAAEARPTVLILAAAVSMLFLIVCTNVASLQLGRGVGRAREIAVRRALGADRARLVRQLLTEGLVLSMVGTAAGVLLASATPGLLLRIAPGALPLFATPRIDWPILAFAVALGLVAPIVFGLLPALSTSRVDRLSVRSDVSSPQTARARELLVALEVGLAVVLVVGSVLLARSLLLLQHVDPGFNPANLVSFKVSLPRARYPQDADQARGFAEIERRLRDIAGAQSVGGTSALALRGATYTSEASVEGRAATDFERELRHKSITPDYFRTMGIRLLAGRFFTAADGPKDTVTIVNEALARQYFGGANPVGKRIKFGRPADDDAWMTIVGVVSDEKQDGLDRETRPEAYAALVASTQNPLTYVIRSSLSDAVVVDAARKVVRAVDKELTITDVAPLTDVVAASIAGERFRTMLIAGFAVVAVGLAALGIYGVLAYLVSQRSRELGIRLALGARPGELFAMVVRQGMRPVAAGTAAGIATAVALTTAAQSLLFGVRAGDPGTYVAAVGVLGAIAFAACALPAARAMRVDPLVAFRED
ncbi:MAG TPA: ABC transporter permease [Vicinamibacterales bacterium]|nr:ABC transporter permease [Vicinamibacterales bacterium]